MSSATVVAFCNPWFYMRARRVALRIADDKTSVMKPVRSSGQSPIQLPLVFQSLVSVHSIVCTVVSVVSVIKCSDSQTGWSGQAHKYRNIGPSYSYLLAS